MWIYEVRLLTDASKVETFYLLAPSKTWLKERFKNNRICILLQIRIVLAWYALKFYCRIGRLEDYIGFALCLSRALQAGLNISSALSTISHGRNSSSSVLSQSILLALRSGESFSDSCANLCVFPDFFNATIRLGEHTGSLSEQLLGLADYYEIQRQFKRELLEVCAPPLQQSFLAAVLSYLMFCHLFPALSEFFIESNVHPPVWMLPTNSRGWLAVKRLSLLGAGVIFASGWLPVIGNWFSLFFRKLSGLNRLYLVVDYWTFFKSSKTWLKRHASLTDLPMLVRIAAHHDGFKAGLLKLQICLLEGSSLSFAMKQSHAFDEQWVDWIEQAERSRSLPAIFAQGESFYLAEGKRALKKFKKIIQGFAFGLLMLCLSTLAFCVYGPIFYLSSKLVQ